MISVGAVDEYERLRGYSSTGPVTWEGVKEYGDFPWAKNTKPGLIKPELCAPSEIPGLAPDGRGYIKKFGGTSSATPHVAGVVALLLSHFPSATVAKITEALLRSAQPVSGSTGYDNRCGGGRVDALAADQFLETHL